jgi:CBS domain-containing protein
MRIKDVLAAKPRHDVITATPGSSVRDLVAQLGEHNLGALVVSTDGTHLAGIVSERDVVRHLGRDASVLDQSVESIMTQAVHTCTAEDKLDDLLQLMTEQRVRHIPVVDGDVLVGIVSIGDLVKHKISALEFERDQLDSYVHQS